MKKKSQINLKYEPKEILLPVLSPNYQSPLPVLTNEMDDSKPQIKINAEPTIRAYNAVMRFHSCINKRRPS